MHNISKSVAKRDNHPKTSGEALYVEDRLTKEILYGRLLRSKKARAKILSVTLPILDENYIYVDKNDVPGENCVAIVENDLPVFADGVVEYIGDTIGMIVGPDRDRVKELVDEVVIEYEELIPVLNMDDSETVFFDYNYSKGDLEKSFSEADKVYESTFETGYQEQAYLETQGLIARPNNGKITVHGSMQCPYYVKGAVVKALGCEDDKVQIIQDETGGGFGGKEDYPSILATQVAVAALKVNKPVAVIFDREEDMEFTSKRHPSKNFYRVALKDGKITAMDIDVRYNSGAYTTLSAVVLQRGIICANGVYDIPNLKVRGRALKTNTVPTGAYRGFGGPQTFFSIENFMNHIAKDLGEENLAFKERHLVKKGDPTSTSGKYHFTVPLPDMISQIDKISDYRKKKKEYKNQTGRYRKGIGISLYFHGAGFTGSGERDLIKAVAKIRKNSDDTVELLTANTDMGQGLKTTFTKIVANELNIPMEQIIIKNPDTDEVPDSGPTVASRSLMIVGELLRRASVKLKDIWTDGVEQTVEEHYKQPDFVIPFDIKTFNGDAYPTYSWGVSVVELEVDMLTGYPKVIGAYGAFDVGTPIDENIVIGQMEGGVMQGIGHASMEFMNYDNNGRIRNNTYSDYIIPTSLDVPNLQCVLSVVDYPEGPYGAKGAGELPVVGVPAAYTEALEQALDNGENIKHIPFTTEDIMSMIRKENL